MRVDENRSSNRMAVAGVFCMSEYSVVLNDLSAGWRHAFCIMSPRVTVCGKVNLGDKRSRSESES
jgi:hypothetical protein